MARLDFPTTALKEFLIACDEGHKDEARKQAKLIVTWLDYNGILPDARHAVNGFKEAQDGP
jgi:hypothetical protein